MRQVLLSFLQHAPSLDVLFNLEMLHSSSIQMDDKLLDCHHFLLLFLLYLVLIVVRILFPFILIDDLFANGWGA